MSSQKGNVSRSRGQKHQNSFAFKPDKYGATVQVKKAKSKIHDGLCQHCKGVLEWKVKYNKYKTLTQPKKWFCPSLCRINSQEDQTEEEEEEDGEQKMKGQKKNLDGLDSDEEEEKEEDDDDDDDDEGDNIDRDSEPKKTQNKTDVLPDVSRVTIKD
ncbi:uncharacterized protein C9orf85 homolog [Etheostoma cragini]|uniref:uncharacterized protein C9orf85 homolog n=1 Tax=Etheostoma cragini TaxID=417921 RepID=UPI00155F0C15|nr:uncharacterized protein C9orf85 homolog [Etheostoma cragini]